MINHSQLQQQAIELLIKYWSKYTKLKKSHFNWALDNSSYTFYSKGSVLYEEGSTDKYVYIVCDGLLARLHEDDESEKTNFFSIAIAGMGLMTTKHLFSASPSQGRLVALRPSHVLSIPYAAIHKRKKKDSCVEILVDVLNSKKKKQLVNLRILSLIDSPSLRYLSFCQQMPSLKAILSQREIAMLLNISRSTIQRSNPRLP